ncbi:MAG: hypothetical protein J0G94_09885 [Sphingomonadales bacterium]|nr:hypothetical protein [Sphingomonadales bacterium]
MSPAPIKILLQTTIVPTDNAWSIARFGQLAKLLAAQVTEEGTPRYHVVARDRCRVDEPDPVLSTLDSSGFDQLWLFAVDFGDGLTTEDCAAILRFHNGGGGLMITRDHMDLGSSICGLGDIGGVHYFHTHNPNPDVAAHVRDDLDTTHISWPNFHSGRNGDYQLIIPIMPIHPVLFDPASPTGAIRHLPSHPHEGGVLTPNERGARIIVRGQSKASGQMFNIAAAFEGLAGAGRAIAQSTFHHFADYNWDVRAGAPTFVTEPTGDGLIRNPQALADTHRYAINLAAWLGARTRS